MVRQAKIYFQDKLAMSLELSETVRDNIYKDFSKQYSKVPSCINSSFLSDEYKQLYLKIINFKYAQIDL